MAYLAVHMMNLGDASQSTIPLPYPVFGLTEKVHQAVFLESPIDFEQYPQLRKLQMECWAILAKYFGNDLSVLIQECQAVAGQFQTDEHIHSIFRQLGEIGQRAQDTGLGLVCTGD